MKILLAGEGRTELGDWLLPAHHREANRRASGASSGEHGVLEAVIAKTTAAPCVIGAAVQWSKIRKYRVGARRGHEERAVLGLGLHAAEAGCEVVAFVRDHEGHDDRREAIEGALEEFAREHPGLRIIGGVATQEIEGWVLAFSGEARSETYTDPKRVCSQRGLESTAQKVAIIASADLSRLPDDAHSLRLWLYRARVLLGTASAS